MLSNSNNVMQYPDVANYLQQSGSTMAVAPPFNPISSGSLFGNSAFVNDYVTAQVKPTAFTRYDFLLRMCMNNGFLYF